MRRLKTFPFLIAVTAASCAFIMVKYRAPKLLQARHAKVQMRKPLMGAPLLISKDEKKVPSAVATPALPVATPSVAASRAALSPRPGKARKPLAAKRRHLKKVNVLVVVTVPEVPGVDSDLETAIELALDTSSPLDQIVAAAFSENSMTPVFAEMPAAAPDDILPLEQKVGMVVGVITQNEFPELARNLSEIKQGLEVAGSELTTASKAVKSASLSKSTATEMGPQLVVPTKVRNTREASALARASKPVVAMSLSQEPMEEELRRAFNIKPGVSTKAFRSARLASAAPSLEEIVGPSLSSLTPSMMSSAVSRTMNTQAAPDRMDSRGAVTGPLNTQDREALFEGKIIGKIEVDTDVLNWLFDQRHRGHLEIYLRPVGSPDPQDLVMSDQVTPQPEFSFQERKWKGAYRLTAGFFFESSQQAEAEVHFPELITVDNFRRHFKFRIEKKHLSESLRGSRRPNGERALVTAIIYEAVPGDHRVLSPIKGAKIRVLGLSSLGAAPSNDLGEAKVAGLPLQSEVVLEVTAPGYLPAYRAVTTSRRSTHVPIYLVRDQWVKAATGSPFIGNPQDPRAGVVVGRLFDPQTQVPKANERIQISSREPECRSSSRDAERVYYFDIFPYPLLPATTNTGFFGFFNVGPCLRRLLRPETRTAMLFVRPGSGQYVELGRGGKQDLLGRLVYPSSGTLSPVAGAKVRLARDPKSEVETDDRGHFQIDAVDLQAGVIHLETQANGFPNTWHPVRWDPKERKKRRTLFLLPYHETPRVELTTGTVLGMARPQFYGKAEGCFTVRLLDAFGHQTSVEKGPFPLNEKGISKEQVCLNQASRGFGFTNLDRGEYLLQWLNPNGDIFRTHVLHVAPGRMTISID